MTSKSFKSISPGLCGYMFYIHIYACILYICEFEYINVYICNHTQMTYLCNIYM